MTTETFNQANDAVNQIHHHEWAIKRLSDEKQRFNDLSDAKNYNKFTVGPVVYPAIVGNKVVEYLLDYHRAELQDAQAKLIAL